MTSKSQNDDIPNENAGKEEPQQENETRTPKSSANPAQPNRIVTLSTKRTASHMRNLSPVDIVTLSSDELRSNKTVVNSPVASQVDHNRSLRRSLFAFNQPKLNSKSDPVCSTPLAGHQRISRRSFFEEKIGNSLSPIKFGEKTPRKPAKESTDSSNVADESMKGIEPIEEPAPAATKVNSSFKITHVGSLAGLDNDLRIQYEIMEPSNSRNTQRPVEVVASTQSSTSINNEAQDEQMDFEVQSISGIQKNQSKRSLSFQNKTDVNSVRMIETPVCSNHKRKALSVDKVLSIKLRRCEESPDAEPSDVVISSELSDDIDVAPISAIEKNVSIKPVESEFLFVEPAKAVRKPRALRGRARSSVTASRTSAKSQELPFIQATPQLETNRKEGVATVSQPIAEDTLEESNNFSSSSRLMPNEILNSFRNLKKTKSRVDEQEEPKSLRINKPQKRKIGNVNVSAQSYLSLTNKSNTLSKKDSTSRKRILYSGDSPEPRSQSDAPSQSQPSSTTSERVNINIPTEPMDVDVELVETDENPIPSEEEVKRDVPATQVKKPLKAAKKPPAKLRPRKKIEKNNSDSIENIPPSRIDDEDEGFSSERSPSDKEWGVIKYDPYAQGCQRPGLRVRRIARPYWIHNGEAETYGITYGVMSKNEADLQKFIQFRKPASEKMKQTKPKAGSKSQSKKVNSSKSTSYESDSQVETSAASAIGSKVINLKSNDSLASLIQSIRDGSVSSDRAAPSVRCDSFGKNFTFTPIVHQI